HWFCHGAQRMVALTESDALRDSHGAVSGLANGTPAFVCVGDPMDPPLCGDVDRDAKWRSRGKPRRGNRACAVCVRAAVGGVARGRRGVWMLWSDVRGKDRGGNDRESDRSLRWLCIIGTSER